MKNTYTKLISITFFILTAFYSQSQGLESVIVEEVDASSAQAGFTAYRVYIDMAPGYQIQGIYGDDNNTLSISTTTSWYNDMFGGTDANAISDALFVPFPTVAFDSYVSINAASSTRIGVQAIEDMDGTVDGRIDGTVVALTAAGINAELTNNFGTGAVGNSLEINTVAGGSWATTGDNSDQTPSNSVYIGQFTTDGEFSMKINVQLRNTATNDVERYVWANPNDANETLFPSLSFPLVLIDGCTDTDACNYNPAANNDDGSCLLPGDSCDDGNAMTINDIYQSDCDCEGTLVIDGCTDSDACNYNPTATNDDGSCLIPVDNCSECDGMDLVLIDYDDDGDCDATDPDIDGDGVENDLDDEPLNEFACQDSDNDTCDDCSSGTFDPANDGIDSDSDGICDGAGVLGCTDADACNYNPAATMDDGSCDVPDPDCEICDGDMSVLDPANDTNTNGLCDSTEIMGCTDNTACNYEMMATFDDGSCVLPGDACDDGDAATINDIIQPDCSCAGEAIVMGCTDESACNYDASANMDDGTCELPGDPCDDGNANTFDDVLQADCSCMGTEIVNGCIDPMACNYDPLATVDDGSCIIPDPDCEICENGVAVLDPAADTNNNGICDLLEGGFEDMIVEVYYVSDASDAQDTDGGSLPVNAVTYRVYMDLSPAAEMQGVYGDNVDTLFITTDTEFFNNEDRGEVFGSDISFIYLEDNTVALDSYLAIGKASSNHVGVPKANDTDGSIVGGVNNDGGSEGVAEGLLINDDPATVGIPLTTSDGLISGSGPSITTVGLGAADALFANQNAAGTLELNDVVGGAWVVTPSFVSPEPENQVLVGQFTTDGIFDFCMNIQIRVPQPGGDVLVEKIPNLCYTGIPGCTDPSNSNYNPDATVNNGECSVNLDEIGFLNDFDIYPNPASEQLTFSIELEKQLEDFAYEIMDVQGKTILGSNINSTSLNQSNTIDISQLERGVYFLNLFTSNGYLTGKKFVKVD